MVQYFVKNSEKRHQPVTNHHKVKFLYFMDLGSLMK